ncbi:TIGR00725 family protein [Candidatus Woesearchaeota archaeon]|nr:TIGR00725 family protein [Candidatus Woesearchaeota archaeon]
MRIAQVGIIGPEEKNMGKDFKERFLSLSFEIGKKIAERGGILITGGCSGIAEAACRGAQEVGGITVGTPGPERGSSVSSVVVEICTPINVGDYLFAGTLSSDVIIVFPGDAGTLAEIAIAYRYGKPLVLLQGVSDGLLERLFCKVQENYPQYVVKDADEAVTVAMRIAEEKLNKLKENR